jgi:hypothetical protein
MKIWMIGIFLGLILLGMFVLFFNFMNNSEITGEVIKEQNTSSFLILKTLEGEIIEFPIPVKESIENSRVFDYWKLKNKDQIELSFYDSQSYGVLLETFESKNLKIDLEEICGNELFPEEMVLYSDEETHLEIRVNDGKIICDVILEELA